MATDRYTKMMAAYLAGELSAARQRELLAWLAEHPDHQARFDDFAAIWAQTPPPALAPPDVDMPAAWSRLDERLFGPAATPARPPLRARRGPRWPAWVAAAAAVVFLLGVGWWWWSDSRPAAGIAFVETVTAADEKRELLLPDGSRVWLNADSRLRYAVAFTERNVELSGEAFFDVVRDSLRPFRVKTPETVTTVLGTSFNVRAYPAEPAVSVTVKTGTVALTPIAQPEERVQIAVGETAVYQRREAAIVRPVTASDNLDAWRRGRLEFTGEPLRTAIPAIERFFGLTVIVDNERILHCRIHGDYYPGELNGLVEALPFMLTGLEVEQRGDTLRLTGAGCDPQ